MEQIDLIKDRKDGFQKVDGGGGQSVEIGFSIRQRRHSREFSPLLNNGGVMLACNDRKASLHLNRRKEVVFHEQFCEANLKSAQKLIEATSTAIADTHRHEDTVAALARFVVRVWKELRTNPIGSVQCIGLVLMSIYINSDQREAAALSAGRV
jgi:hypothetical protein